MKPFAPIDEASLHAYVDGQLTPAEAAEVAHWLQQNPADAQRVLTWRSQRSALQGLHGQLLDEPVPTDMLERLRRPALAENAPRYRLVQALGGAGLLALGLVLGWGSHAWLQPDPAAMARAEPAFVRDAAIAHAVYLPERRHPVEVGAEQQDHLVQWLSKRLGRPLRVPVLSEQGYRLMGGRLLPAGEAGPHPARAQFMFENAGGERLTLYVSVVDASEAAATAFRFADHGQGEQASRSFYWVDGQLGYALTGRLSPELLGRLGHSVYRQLGM